LNAQDSVLTDPDPSRFQEEIEQFVNWDEKNSWPEDAILFIGSSSIRLWKTRLAFPDLPVINRGFGGAHISDILHYYETVVLPYQPSVIVFYCGDNDIASDKSVDRVYKDYQSFVSRVSKDFPAVKLIYLPVKPSGSRWDMWPEMQKVNNRIKAFHEKKGNFYYVDTASPLIGENGEPDDTLFLEDALHLNAEGYDRWNQVLETLLRQTYLEKGRK
jgi:lysophospholipase L1-like esterase